jgi:hypothetical protein
MPRLTISLPDELRRGQQQGDTRSQTGRSSRRLGSGIEGADETSQQLIRWLDCWASSDD